MQSPLCSLNNNCTAFFLNKCNSSFSVSIFIPSIHKAEQAGTILPEFFSKTTHTIHEEDAEKHFIKHKVGILIPSISAAFRIVVFSSTLTCLLFIVNSIMLYVLF